MWGNWLLIYVKLSSMQQRSGGSDAQVGHGGKNSILVVSSTHLLALLPLEGIILIFFFLKVGREEVSPTLSSEI